MNHVNIPEDFFKGKKKGFIKRFNHNIHNMNHIIYQAKLKGRKYIRFTKGTGQSHLLSDEEFNMFIEILENQFDVNLECSYGGDGERFFDYTIGWE